MIDLGDIYPASLNVFDQNGNPVNASTVTLAITLPDQTIVMPPVQNPPAVTGQYVVQYVTTEPGRHMVRWTSTSPVTAWTDVFDVAELNPPSIISLASAKKQLNMDPTFTNDDEELREKLAAITAAVQYYKHEQIVYTSVTDEYSYGSPWGYPTGVGFSGLGSGRGRGRLRLWTFPPVSLVSIASLDGQVTWDTNNFYLDTKTGLVTLLNGPPLRGDFLITYMAGYQIIPYNYLEGAKVLLQHVWETRRGPGGVGGVIGPEELADYRHYTAMPRKVMEWLGPPRPVIA